KSTTNSKGRTKLTGADLRNAQKELGSVTRKLEKVTTQIDSIHGRFASHDQGDFTGLAALQKELGAQDATKVDLELRWLELSEVLEA
ncbi:MAG: ABC transporter ATP-binding protein, partial [Kineosporiaceae bacterium]|nr:ABC transporter ATP-binding protein [Aeromicrobium sp.]